MSFDQEPERDAHDECRFEINRLKQDSERLEFLLLNNARVHTDGEFHWLVFYDHPDALEGPTEGQPEASRSAREAIDLGIGMAGEENDQGVL